MKTFEDISIAWFIAFCVAATQIFVAILAVYSSSHDRLSDGAYIGGHFGTLANLAILAVVLIWLIVLVVKSSHKAKWHDGVKPLSAVALASTISIFIGLEAALHCTV